MHARSTFSCAAATALLVALFSFDAAGPPSAEAYAEPIVSASFPIVATAAPEWMGGSAFDGTNLLVGVGAFNGNAPVTAQRVSANGALVGSLIKPGRQGAPPRVAFDGSRHLMVWRDDAAATTLYGQFVTPAGVKSGAPFLIAGATIDTVEGFAFGGGVYLVTYKRDLGVGHSKLYGKIIQPNGTAGSEFAISSQTVKGDGGLAFDGTRFFQSWTDDWPAATVRGRFVRPSGALGAEIVIDDSAFKSDNPGWVAFDGTNYLVTWMDDVGGANGWDLFGRLVTPAGTFPGTRFPISEAAGSQFLPAVAAGGGKWLVTWSDLTNDADQDFVCDAGEGTCWDVYGLFLTSDGAAPYPPFAINTAAGNQIGAPGGYFAGKFAFVYADLPEDATFGAGGDVRGLFVSETSAAVVSIVATDDTATEAGPTSGLFTVKRTGDTSADLTVTYGVGGSAVLGSDYLLAPSPVGTILIPAGSAKATITVTPRPDPAGEWTETVTLALTAGAGYVVGTPGSAIVSIESTSIGTVRVSRDSSGLQANGESREPAISADGRWVAFMSNAENLVPGGTNGVYQVFFHDRETGKTTLVSRSTAGVQGNNVSEYPAISADGRYVSFHSKASNLVAGDTNGTWDVFVHDRMTGVTSRVSVNSAGAQGNNESGETSSISGDGRCVAFMSRATNLVAGDTNGTWDVFVHDRMTRATTRVSRNGAGVQGNSNSGYASISTDGRFVAFMSVAANLVAGDTNGTWDVFVHDRSSGATMRVSRSTAGAQGNNVSAVPAISGDGRYVAFMSLSTNLVAGDTNGTWDVFVHDRSSGATARVSRGSSGAQGKGASEYPAISRDGRYVTFQSLAANLVAGDTNGKSDVFLHDRTTGKTVRLSRSTPGTQANNASESPSISKDGRWVAFESLATNLVAGDTNGKSDVFVGGPLR